jgi:NADPH-dependent 2,4-dienoyl-CoA reductase/sulfur reductase-like enzyme
VLGKESDERMDERAEITIIQKLPELSMASCGYPYYVGGFFDDRDALLCSPTGVVRDPTYYLNVKNIVALTETEAIAIDRENKLVTCKNLKTGETFAVGYASLVLATGTVPVMPPVPGCDLEGITTLQSIRDADYLRKVRDEGKIGSVPGRGVKGSRS